MIFVSEGTRTPSPHKYAPDLYDTDLLHRYEKRILNRYASIAPEDFQLSNAEKHVEKFFTKIFLILVNNNF
jgi:hypothetical protein